MATRIGLISDVHATPAPVEEALLLFRQQGIEQVFCLGDIAGYGSELEPTVALLREYDVECIRGNHEQWYLDDHADATDEPVAEFFHTLPTFKEMIIEGTRIYMVHASPPNSMEDGINLLDEHDEKLLEQQLAWAGQLDGFEHDVLIVGHTHQVFAELIANTLVINPGSTWLNHSCAILSLPDKTVEWLPLSGEHVQHTHNWSGGLPGSL